MPSFYSASSFQSATAYVRGASGANGSENKDSPVRDMILYLLLDFFNKIRMFVRFKQICPVFTVHRITYQQPLLLAARLEQLAQKKRKVR